MKRRLALFLAICMTLGMVSPTVEAADNTETVVETVEDAPESAENDNLDEEDAGENETEDEEQVIDSEGSSEETLSDSESTDSVAEDEQAISGNPESSTETQDTEKSMALEESAASETLDTNRVEVITEEIEAVSVTEAVSSISVSVTSSDEESAYTYEVNDGTATITGYTGSSSELSIPETIDGYTVTAIADGAFEGNAVLASVVIPDTVISIGNNAFNGCTYLTQVKLSSNLKSLGDHAFACSSLTEITIPASLSSCGWYEGGPFAGSGLVTAVIEDGMETIPQWLFSRAEYLCDVTIPDSVIEIEGSVFLDCVSLTSIDFPSYVTIIGSSAFEGCTSLISIEIPDSVLSIGDYAFSECSSLEQVKLSSNLKTLGNHAFACSSLTEITIPASLSSCGWYEGGPFAGSGLVTAIIEDGMETIPQWLFSRTEYLCDVTIPDSVTEIEGSVFLDCVSLTSIDIPSYVTIIGSSAFEGCTALTSIDIPDSVVDIGDYAFSECSSLEQVKLSSNLKTLGNHAFACSSLTEITIPASLSSCGWYEGGPFAGSGLVTAIIEDGMETIPQWLFSRAEYLCNVTIPDSVIEIEGSVFLDCVSLVAIEIPDSVLYMGSYVFSGCTSLTDVTWNNTIDTIPSGTFYGCTGLTEFTLPSIVTGIESSAFEDCTSLKTVSWSDNLTVISECAFKNCDALIDLSFPSSLLKIENSAFYDCDGIVTVVILDGAESIGQEAFYNCDSLTTVVISNTVQSIGARIFYDCDALVEVALGTGLTEIPESAFYSCSALESITIPGKVTTISDYAFKSCYALISVTIPNSVVSIGTQVFSYPAKMTIYGEEGSYAETYASNNSITFVAVDLTEEPDAPEIVSVYSTVQTSVKVTWTEVEDADGYQIYRSTEEDGTYTCVKTITSGSTVSYTNSGLTVGQTYYYKVRAYAVDSSNNRVYSDFSEVRYMPAAVNFSSVYSNSTSRIRILWNEVDGAEGYQIWRADSEDGTYSIVKTITEGSTTSYSNTGLESGHTYYYKMRAYTTVDGSKVFGVFSDVVAVPVMPETVIFENVYSNATNRVRILWSEVDGAAGYQIWRADSETGTFTIVKTITNGSTTAYSNTGLESGHTYYYKMRAYSEANGSKVYGAYSETVAVSVMPDTPELSVSSNTSGIAKLSWNEIEGAAGYQIWRADSENGTYTLVKSITDGGTTSYSNSGLTSKATYYYKVRAYSEVNGNKTFGAYSEIMNVNVK